VYEWIFGASGESKEVETEEHEVSLRHLEETEDQTRGSEEHK